MLPTCGALLIFCLCMGSSKNVLDNRPSVTIFATDPHPLSPTDNPQVENFGDIWGFFCEASGDIGKVFVRLLETFGHLL